MATAVILMSFRYPLVIVIAMLVAISVAHGSTAPPPLHPLSPPNG